MAVFLVRIVAPNGNSMSGPVVAEDGPSAIANYFRQNRVIHEPAFTVDVQQLADPDNSYERDLLDRFRRALEVSDG